MQKIRGLALVTATAALACGVAAATAAPALAAAPNEAYAADATGLINGGPLDLATYPGTSPVTASSDTIAGLITLGLLTDTATATSASSTIANAGVATTLLPSLLAATAVSSSCTFDPDSGTVSGTSTIAGLSLSGGATTSYTALTAPLTLTIPLIATVTLDNETTVDGTLTVDAVSISLVGTTQTLDLGVSVCNDSTLAGAPALPGIATPIGASLAGLVGLGGVGYFFSRRRRVAAQA